MNIADVLLLPGLEEAKIVAGADGKDTKVRNVNMMDAPDISSYLQANDLLVTTAYHFKDDTFLLLDLIQHMSREGCAGLGIKTKRFLNEIPQDALQLAEMLNFPIIDLPSKTSLSSIVNQILSSILNMRTNELQQAINSHQKFTEHIMSGKGLKTLLIQISEIAGHHVLLLDPHTKLLHSSHDYTSIQQEIEELNTKGFQLFLPRTTFTSFSIFTKQQVQTVAVFPIYTHQKNRGILVVLGELDYTDSGAVLSIEQATNVIAFELMKENALKQQAQRAKNEFFINYLDGAFSSNEEITNRAKEFGIIHDHKYTCIVGKLDRDTSSLSFATHQRETDDVFEFVEGELSDFPFSPHFFTKGDSVVIVAVMNDSSPQAYSDIQAAMLNIQQRVGTYFQRHVSFGVSSTAPQFTEVKHAVTEAEDTLQTGYLSGKKSFIQTYQTKDIAELLRIIPADELKKFYSYTLQKLAQPAHQDDHLLHTLFVYLETHCQISETAKRLYIHRNTVIYRLEKCEELLQGASLKDPDTTLRLRLAFRIQHTLPEKII
ncbi:PucR family transcriptional regulator [Alteribacillus sp. HJP-4]|uniref:PucR family transcriptional regulator n=1 Tax=Alteribacillus sp. HJP-4 TaxID=2775394 RepID=UPI0035CCEE39